METRYFKGLIYIILTSIIMAVMCSCSTQSADIVSLYDLNTALNEVAEFSDMKYVSSNDNNVEKLFANISDMDYSKIESFYINYASNGTGNADEIACIQLKNRKDVNEAVSSLEAHLQKRTALYDTYDKSQSQKLSKAVVTSYGNVAILIVGDKAEDIESAFNNFFGE